MDRMMVFSAFGVYVEWVRMGLPLTGLVVVGALAVRAWRRERREAQMYGE